MSNYIPVLPSEKEEMLNFLGISSVEELFSVIPEKKRIDKLELPPSQTEAEVFNYFQNLVDNKSLGLVIFAGGGVADHWIPAAVDEITSRAEFYTAYTPYQPEVSQGTLQSIYEYQSFIVNLTGMEVANASMYDGPTALAEAVLMLLRIFKKKSKVLIAQNIYSHWKKVIRTYLSGLPFELEEVSSKNGKIDLDDLKRKLTPEVAGFAYQTPNLYGYFEDIDKIGEILSEAQVGHLAAVEPLSLAMVESPAYYGADIIVGEGQPLGQPLSFGGPYFGFFATREKFIKNMPGRVVGKTVDVDGKEAYVLTFQTREQHIRRARATSNICSNQALCALRATIYMSLLGKKGLESLASQIVEKSHYLYENLLQLPGIEPYYENEVFFKEFPVKVKNADVIRKKLLKKGIFAGVKLKDVSDFEENEDVLIFCVTEKRTKEEIDLLISYIKDEMGKVE